MPKMSYDPRCASCVHDEPHDHSRACESCGSYKAERDGLCAGCAHAVEYHASSRAAAYAVECHDPDCESR